MQLFQKIIVAVDSSLESNPELERAVRLVESAEGSSLHLVDVLNDLNFATRIFSSQITAEHEKLAQEKVQRLQVLVAQLAARGFTVTSELLRGSYSQQLIRLVETMQADLVVRSAKGAHSKEEGTLGATASQLLSRAPCALWLTQGDQSRPVRRILAAIDATPEDEAHRALNKVILQRSRSIAEREGAELSVVYAWDIYGAELLRGRLPESEFDEIIERNRELHAESFDRELKLIGMDASSPQARLVRGEPSKMIPSLCSSEEIDLLVCGTVARVGLTGLMIGNTANRMLRQVSSSILALKPDLKTRS